MFLFLKVFVVVHHLYLHPFWVFPLAGAVSDGLHKHAVVAALVAVQNVAHGLGQAALAVNVELGEGVVYSVGQTHDPREAVVIASAPVE